MSFYISLAVTFEIIFIILAIFSEIRRQIDSFSEAYVYAVILILSIFSVSIQFFFLFDIHELYPVVDASLLLVSTYLLYRNRQILSESYKALKLFYMQNPFFAFSLSFFSACLFIKGFLLPPATVDSMTYHLARVLMMQNAGTYFLENFNDYRQDIMPIGYDILHFLYLRFYTDYGLATFGFISYTVLLSGIFALTTACFSDVRLSKATCFISASLTMFLVNATSTKNDLILAAITVGCFLSAYNFVKTKKWLYLFMLMVALIFGLSTKLTFGAFVLPFVLFCMYLYYKYIYFKADMKPMRIKPTHLFFGGLPLGLISLLLVLFAHNHMKYGGILGPGFYLKLLSGPDGPGVGVFNLLRYFFQSMDLPPELGGNRLTMLHDLILGKYKSAGLFPGIPIHYVQMAGSLFADDVHAWYGLLGLPILTSIFGTVFWGMGFLRGLALTILSYAVIVTFTMPWATWNGRFFAPLFAGGMVCFAFMLQEISRKSIMASKYIMGCALLIAGFNLAFQVVYANIYFMPQLGMQVQNRGANFPNFNTDKIPSGSKILVISPTNFPIFPLYLRRPDLHITLTGIYNQELYREPLMLKGKEYNLHKVTADEAQEIQKQFNKIFSLGS
jgi:hypothetical protein